MAEQTLVDRLAATDAVDAVVVLGRGAAVNFADGQGVSRIRTAEGDLAGWAWIRNRPPLLTLLGWLHTLPMVQLNQSPLHLYLGQEEGIELLLPSPPSIEPAESP